MSLTPPIIRVLLHFRPAFTALTWRKVLVLVVGTLLAHGRRTVAAALRQMGLAQDARFSTYHHVLNRASWSSLLVSRLLLLLLVNTFVGMGCPVEIVIDETLERRWGPKITKRGRYRDNLRSARDKSISASGLRWVVMMLVVNIPWTNRQWALPFLSVLCTPPKVSEQLHRHHRTVGEIALLMVRLVRRWLPNLPNRPDRTLPIKVIGDRAYSIVQLAVGCTYRHITLIAPLRLDSCLYAPPPPRLPSTKGRLRVKGEALPKLSAMLNDPGTKWRKLKIRWYYGHDGVGQTLQIATGCALWYKVGAPQSPPLPIRWVLTRDPKGRREAKAYFTTDPSQRAEQVIEDFMKRWTIEVTFEESRAHLGIETQRQWSDPAIERSTSSLLGLYSVVALFGKAVLSYAGGRMPVQRTAWYRKRQATFTDVLAYVRRHLWGNFDYSVSEADPLLLLVPRTDMARLAYTVCY